MAIPASAQWQWTDKNGHKVFSDQPPSFDIPESAISRRPGDLRPPAPAESAAPVPSRLPSTQAPRGKDAELEKRKAQAEAQTAARKKDDEDKAAAARAENCARAQRGIANLQNGTRIVLTTPAGEREYLSDEARASEIQRMQGIAATDCR